MEVYSLALIIRVILGTIIYIFAVLVYVANIIRQKILTNKLNKQLNIKKSK